MNFNFTIFFQLFKECDCGPMETCLSKKSCCVQPGGGPKNQNQCTWNAMRTIRKHCKD